jgi:hypothetical protein
MSASRRTLAAALCFALAACGGKHGNEGFDGGTSAFALALVGGANLVVHPGDKRTLQVVLTQDQVGPVGSVSVHFEFQDGDPAGAKIDAEDINTDASGIATVHFTAGTNAGGRPTFKVVASAPSVGPDPVAFSFNVIPVRRLLQIVGTPTTRVSSDGASAATSVGVSTSAALKVRELDSDTGAAIAGDTISFTLPPVANAKWSGSSDKKASAQTGAGGEAQVFLLTTAQHEGPWQVVAQSAAGGAAVTFNVTVQAAGGSSCTTNSQCGPGQICAGDPPHCQDGGGGSGCDNGSDNPCPFGYLCVGGVCQPPSGAQCDPQAPNCANGQCCDAGTLACRDICASPCAAGTHCQPGATCGSGTCIADSTSPDVTGVWLTKHDYAIREALPQTVQDIFKAIRLLDQALLGKLTIPGVPKWLQDIINAFISKLLQQYLPDWLQQIIHISDDIVTILSNLRSEGSMRLVKGADIAHLKGTEVWTSLVFYWLPLCNGEIGGDPGLPPDCARIDLATTDSENPGEVAQCKGQSLPSITVQVRPFSATVAGAGAGGGAPYTLSVDQRQVNIKMGKVILVLVDLLISYFTPYHCVEEATDCSPGNTCLVDCAGLGQDVENATGGLISAGTVEALCDGVVTAAGHAVTVALAGAWPVNADVLDFSGRATVNQYPSEISNCDSPSPGNCAGQLGNDTWDKDLNTDSLRGNRDGSWNGDFFFKMIHKLPGAWEAKRAMTGVDPRIRPR